MKLSVLSLIVAMAMAAAATVPTARASPTAEALRGLKRKRKSTARRANGDSAGKNVQTVSPPADVTTELSTTSDSLAALMTKFTTFENFMTKTHQGLIDEVSGLTTLLTTLPKEYVGGYYDSYCGIWRRRKLKGRRLC